MEVCFLSKKKKKENVFVAQNCSAFFLAEWLAVPAPMLPSSPSRVAPVGVGPWRQRARRLIALLSLFFIAGKKCNDVM